MADLLRDQPFRHHFETSWSGARLSIYESAAIDLMPIGLLIPVSFPRRVRIRTVQRRTACRRSLADRDVQERAIREVHADHVTAISDLVLEVEAQDGFTRQERCAIPTRDHSNRVWWAGVIISVPDNPAGPPCVSQTLVRLPLLSGHIIEMSTISLSSPVKLVKRTVRRLPFVCSRSIVMPGPMVTLRHRRRSRCRRNRRRWPSPYSVRRTG